MNKKAVSAGFGVLFALLGAVLIFPARTHVFERYVQVAPRVEDAVRGFIVEYNAHGTIVYLSESQVLSLQFILASGVACLAVSMFLLRRFIVH